MSAKQKTGGRSRTALWKNILREILGTKSRFFAIFAIIGISVGFFSGLKSSSPSMLTTAEQYFDDSRLMDIRLLSTIGFDDDDIKDIKDIDFVEQVMPGYFSDLIISQDNVDTVVRVYSLPQKTATNRNNINDVVLREGRLPKNEGECVIEKYFLGMSGYSIGDEIEFNEKVEGKNTLDIIRRLKYKIVGVVDSPLYLTYLRGNTTIGDGTITFYMLIPPEEFAYERYTLAFLRTKASSGTGSELSDEYKHTVTKEKEYLEKFSEQCIDRFNTTTLADARKEFNDARKEYNEQKTKALDKLSKGEKELYEGAEELYTKTGDAKKQIDDGEKELEDGRAQLTQGQEDYQTGIEDAKQKLTDAQNQYNEGLAEYNRAKLEYDTQIGEAERKLNSARTEYNTQFQIFYSSTKPQADTKLSLLKAAIDLCNQAIDKAEKRINELSKSEIIGDGIRDEIKELNSKIAGDRAKLKEYNKQYEEGKKQLEEGEKKLNDAKTQLDGAEEELAQKKAEGAVKLNEAKIQLDNAEGQLANGRLEYETAMTTGMLGLQSAQAKITEGEQKLTSGKKELEEQLRNGQLKLKEGREKLIQGKYDAHVQLSDAEEQLTDAEDKLSSLEDAKWYVYDRDDNPGYSGLVEDAARVDSIAQVFPVFFLLIAGLVCFTTMTRMVEEHRTETGTLKALGYKSHAIAAKYIVYSGAAALTGSIVGTALGVLTLPIIIVNTYGIMYSLPPTILSVNWSSVFLSASVGVVCICLVSLFACYKDLRLTPANLMRPKAPKPGKRILLEHIKPMWNRMNFTSKVTARNLFRYKARFFMTVIGVAGCTALMVAAMGIKDSTTGIADLQFNQLTKYNQIYALSKSDTADKKAFLMSKFHSDDRFESTMLGNMSWVKICKEKDGKTLDVRMTAGQNKEDFESMYVLRDRVSHQKIELTDDGIMLTERIGEVLDLKEGDTVLMTLEDEQYSCKVTGFTENYAGSLGYFTPEFYKNLTGKELKYGLVFTSTAESYKDNERDIANEYMRDDDIITVTSVTEQINTMMDMMSSLDIIILVMIFCAGLLAVVVLYNLTNINIAERVREIATIKVLGFYNLETANFIYRESIVLTVIGSLCGLALGNVFATFIVESIQMDNVMFPKHVAFMSYFLAFVLTIVFSLLVNFIMYFKMKKISMVESLKSIE